MMVSAPERAGKRSGHLVSNTLLYPRVLNLLDNRDEKTVQIVRLDSHARHVLAAAGSIRTEFSSSCD